MKTSVIIALLASAAFVLAVWAVGQSGAAPTPAPSSKSAAAAKPSPTTRPAKSVQKVIFAVAFDNATGQDQYDPAGAGIGDLIAVMLAQQDGIRVVERQRLDALTAEQARSLRGLTGEKYAVAAGGATLVRLAGLALDDGDVRCARSLYHRARRRWRSPYARDALEALAARATSR